MHSENGFPARDRKKIADRLANGDHSATEFAVSPESFGDIPGRRFVFEERPGLVDEKIFRPSLIGGLNA